MINSRKKLNRKALGVIFLMLMMFMIPLTSAFLPSIVKTDELKQIYQPSPSADKYPGIDIVDWLGYGTIKVRGVLLENTESCGKNCFAEFILDTKQDGVLIDDIKFNGSMRNWNINYLTDVDIYEEKCFNKTNGYDKTPYCDRNLKDTIKVWKNYKLGTEVPKGEYRLRLNGNKANWKTIDWVITTQGVAINEWATWGNISTGSQAEVLLLSPDNNSVESSSLVSLNSLGNVTGGSILVNATLYDNSTGTWGARNTTSISSLMNYWDNEANTDDAWTTGMGTYENGINVTATSNLYVLNVSISTLNNASYVRIVWANGTELASDTAVVNGLATFSNPVYVPSGKSIYVISNKNGASTQIAYKTTTNGNNIGNFTRIGRIYNADYGSSSWYQQAGHTSNILKIGVIANVTTGSYYLNNTNYYPLGSNIKWNYKYCDNDAACGWGVSNRSFSVVTYIENSQTYTSPILEGTATSFNINLTTEGLNVTSARLVYNGSSSTGTITKGFTNNFIMNVSKNVPLVSQNTNFTFYWAITLSDALVYNSTSHNQRILNTLLDNCSNFNYTLFNFTIYDQDTQSVINATIENTLASVEIFIKDQSTDEVVSAYTGLYSQTNPFRVCSNDTIGTNTYNIDAIIRYSSNNRFTQFHNLANFNLTSTSIFQNISLYDLNNTLGQEFKITYKDTNYNTRPGAIYQIQRKYINEGLFKTIEIPKVGSEGFGIGHLIRNNEIYNILVYQNNTLLDSFLNIVAFCQNPAFEQCMINLNSLSSATSPTDFTKEGDFVSKLSWNISTRTVSAIYSKPSGATSNVLLNITLFDVLGITNVCNDSLASSGGTLSCIVPNSFGNATLLVKLNENGVQKRFSIVKMEQTPSDLYGTSLMFVGIIMVLFIIGIGIQEDPKKMIITMIVGLIILGSLNIMAVGSWVGAGATILWGIMALIIILIKGGRR